MPHSTGIYDTDLHFAIDPVTREIRNDSGKVTIVQYDHNSERFTFEIPRYIDGHDMSECNRVEVHYNNIASGRTNRGLYEVTDLQVSPDDDRYVICSWLISQNATMLVGRLAFVVRFACVNLGEEAGNEAEYVWNTAPYDAVKIVSGINNAEEVIYEYTDIIMQWKQDLIDAGTIDRIEQTYISTEENGVNIVSVIMEDGTAYPFEVRNGSKGPRGYSAYEIAVQNGYEGSEAEWNAAVNAARVAAETAAENAEATSNEIRQYLEDVIGNTWERSDELSWTESTLPSHSTWQAITYGNGMFVAIANDSNKTAYSTDGENWTETTNLPSAASWYSVTYGAGKFVAVAYGTKAAYSTDGINWTAVTLPVNRSWRSIAYGNDIFVALASSSNVFVCSTDGINWGDVTVPGSNSWYTIIYGNGLFVAISNGTNEVMCSSDGVNWTLGTIPYSTKWRSIAYGNGLFVAVAYNTNMAAYSTDGLHWTEATLPATTYWCSITYGNGIFMTVTYNATISAYSSDGIHWTELELPSKSYGYYATYGNGRFVAVGWDSSKVIYAETEEIFASRVNRDEVSEIVKSIATTKEYVDGKSYLKTETWTFTLEDGSTVTKVVYVG